MKLENLPNNIFRKIAGLTGTNIGKLNVALVGSTHARNLIRNQKLLAEYEKYYRQRKQNKKLILNFKRKMMFANDHGRGHFNTTTPGVYKNKKWKYFYKTSYYDPKLNDYAVVTLFYNNRNGDPVFIHPITGVRKPVKNERKYLGNINYNTFYNRLKKRSKYNYWNRFTKKATRYISRTTRSL